MFLVCFVPFFALFPQNRTKGLDQIGAGRTNLTDRNWGQISARSVEGF